MYGKYILISSRRRGGFGDFGRKSRADRLAFLSQAPCQVSEAPCGVRVASSVPNGAPAPPCSKITDITILIVFCQIGNA